MAVQDYLDKLRELIAYGRTVRGYQPVYPVKQIIEIDQGGNPKDGRLWIDGKEITFIEKFSMEFDMSGLCTRVRIERILPPNERINAVLNDVDLEIKTRCVHCGSERIDKTSPPPPPPPSPQEDPSI